MKINKDFIERWTCPVCSKKHKTRKEFFEHKKVSLCGEEIKKLGRIKQGVSLSKNIKDGRTIPSWSGRHHSEKTKRFMSERSKNNNFWHFRKLNPIIYKKKDGKEVLFDSNWENLVAERLDELNIIWYKPGPSFTWIDSKECVRDYFPDFYLSEFNIFIETKHPYWASIQNGEGKIDYIKEHYKNIFWIENEIICSSFSIEDLKNIQKYSGIPEEINEEEVIKNVRNSYELREQIKLEEKTLKKKLKNRKKIKSIFISLSEKSLKSKKQKLSKREEKILQRIEFIKNSNIDFSKHGWVTELHKIMNLHCQDIHKFMKNYMKEFYDNCYHNRK